MTPSLPFFLTFMVNANAWNAMKRPIARGVSSSYRYSSIIDIGKFWDLSTQGGDNIL
jgi:hypothetical protein